MRESHYAMAIQQTSRQVGRLEKHSTFWEPTDPIPAVERVGDREEAHMGRTADWGRNPHVVHYLRQIVGEGVEKGYCTVLE